MLLHNIQIYLFFVENLWMVKRCFMQCLKRFYLTAKIFLFFIMNHGNSEKSKKERKCNGKIEDDIATKLIALLNCIIFATLQRDKIA